MRIKSVEITNFKRFTHLVVKDIPETVKLVVMVGPNGSGKTSFLEAFNHYYKFSGYGDVGDYRYLSKTENEDTLKVKDWYQIAPSLVDIVFYDANFRKSRNTGIRSHFYFRSAYRNEPDFQISSMSRQTDPTASVRLSSLMQNDKTVSSNYQRLIANTISELYDSTNNLKTVEDLRDELTGKISEAMGRVFDDLEFSSLGDPLRNGSFYFSKGETENFHYRNLSAGEKSAFDLILDVVIQSQYYPNAIYCIDEPETHMHTRLQGRVLRELLMLIPGESQLWLSTHSIGMLQEAEEIEKNNPGTVAFLDFGDRDYDTDQVIRPSRISHAVIERFYELALGDFAKLMLPKTIVFCEGSSNGNQRKNFDKSIYTTIFEENHPDTLFISGGSCNDIIKLDQTLGELATRVLQSTKIIKVIDRDDRSDNEVSELIDEGVRVLSRRHLEAYLLDDSVILKLCKNYEKEDKYQDCLDCKEAAINNSMKRKNPKDDIKSASGEIVTGLKKILQLTQCGNNTDSFLRDTVAPLITPDTGVYQELERDIFG